MVQTGGDTGKREGRGGREDPRLESMAQSGLGENQLEAVRIAVTMGPPSF